MTKYDRLKLAIYESGLEEEECCTMIAVLESIENHNDDSIDTINVSIWGRSFNLDIKYDRYKDEKVLDSQIDVINTFSKSKKYIDASLEEVKKYCLRMNHDEIGEDTIKNIFSYVTPKYLYVSRGQKPKVSIMCDYKFDQDNGIAVTFDNDKKVKIRAQDMVL